MRFQGEKCALSYGLHFNNEQASLSGTLWPRRPPSREPRAEPLRLHFTTLFTVSELLALQHWLRNDTSGEPLPLSGAVRQITRLPGPDANTVCFDLEFRLDQVPDWWDWPVSFPLCARLEIGPNEFTYLTKSLSHDQWSTDLTW